jgi:hypothetical protein
VDRAVVGECKRGADHQSHAGSKQQCWKSFDPFPFEGCCDPSPVV